MKNTSKENIMYQYDIILSAVKSELELDNINDLDTDSIIEKLQGIKELQIALFTLKN